MSYIHEVTFRLVKYLKYTHLKFNKENVLNHENVNCPTKLVFLIFGVIKLLKSKLLKINQFV